MPDPTDLPPTDPALTPDDAITEIRSNVIAFDPSSIPLWERSPDRFAVFNGQKIKLCRLTHCDKAFYAKGLCQNHNLYRRQGRLDPATGGVFPTKTEKAVEEAANGGQPVILPNMGPVSDWVYIVQTKEFIKKTDIDERIHLSAAIEAAGNQVRSLVRNQAFQVYMTQKFKVFNPHTKELEARTREENGQPTPPPETGFYNTFIPERMMWPRSACTKLSAPLDELLTNLCGDEYHYFERWLAYVLRNPDEPGTAMILRGVHGSGKSVLSALLQTALGPYSASIRISDLENNHNSWLENKLMIFGEEMASGGTREQIKTMNELKKYVSGGMIVINRKHIPQYSYHVRARWMFFSNAKKPLLIEPTERRYNVIESYKTLNPATGKELDENRTKYAQQLIDYLNMVDISSMHAWTLLENEAITRIKADSEKYFVD